MSAAPPQSDQPSESRAPPANPHPLPEIPGYIIEGQINVGGMGVIYRARDIAFDRDVAIKVLKDQLLTNTRTLRRFLDEARITAQLQHPAIPPVHHIGTLSDGRPFLAMKLIKGDTLAELLDREALEAPTCPAGDRAAELAAPRRAEPAEARRPVDHQSHFVAVFAQVCQALAYAHSCKVIHRDLKPSNIMVGAFGEVQVMDWGIAKVLTGSPDEPETEPETERTEILIPRDPDSATQTGSILGTPAFMSPEQAGGAVEMVDERSDVFGLGAVLCTILTGEPPYSDPSPEAVWVQAILGMTAKAFTRLDACGADPELVVLAKWCLARERLDRPQDAGEVAKAVTSHLEEAEDRARQAELERVRVEGERAVAEAKALEERNTRREAEARGAAERARVKEQRKRRRVQLALVGAVLGVFVLAGFGVGLWGLWQAAKSARGDAERARDQIEDEKKQTETARDEAITLKGVAELAQARELAARRDVERERQKLEVFEYGRTVQVAHQEWRDGNILGARALLVGTKPGLRGWEYGHVHRLCNSSLLTIQGHTGVVGSASFSPDGTRIVTGSFDNTAKIWDAQTGKELLGLTGHTFGVKSASFSPDGTRIVTGSFDNTAKIWEVPSARRFPPQGGSLGAAGGVERDSEGLARTGKILLTLKGHTNFVNSAAFRADGARVVTASNDQTAKVWDAHTGKELLTLKGHTTWVASAAFSPDGDRIVTGSYDQTAKVWDAHTGKELLTLKGHTFGVRCVAFSPDGTRILTGSEDNMAKVWDAQTGKVLLVLKGHTLGVGSAAFSADGTRILTGCDDRTAKVWDAQTGKELLTLKEHALGVTSVSFSPDGTRIVTGSYDYTAKVWHAKIGGGVLTFRGHEHAVTSAAFSPDGARIVTGSYDHTAKVWDPQTGKELLTIQNPSGNVQSVSYSPDGARIVGGCADHTARVWDAGTGKELLALTGHTSTVNAASFSPDGSRIVTASWDTTAKVWDSHTGKELLTLKGHKFSVYSAGFSPDGARIVTSGDDKTAKVWDTYTGKELLTIEGHTNWMRAAAFSPDGARIVTGSYDNTAKVWDAHTGSELFTLKGHTSVVYAASFSPDGTRIVTAGWDTAVKVWDAETGAEFLTLKGHTGVLNAASFSRDGTRIVTCGYDNTAKVWDARPVDRALAPRELAPPPHEVTGPGAAR
jgi:WD40 repeat protein/serine/threonine protein kinase